MSFTNSCLRPPRRFGLVLRSFLEQPGLAFSEALPEDHIERVFREEGAGGGEVEEVYTPAVTLWAFLSQVLFKEEQRSCAAAVARVVTLLVALGRPRPSDNTGAYCRARARLPEAALWRLVEDVADGCEQSVPEAWLWKQRHVHLIDGSTTTMPDTEANQAEYPQPSSQQEGLGFPIARFVVLLSLATAMASGFAMGPYKGKETGETALLRQVMNRLSAGDVVLADRYFCGWFTIALLLQQGVDVVTRQHQLRTTDFRRGRRLGRGDHIVSWPRPQRPDWMDLETYQQMPASLEVRELEVRVHQPGFRVESFVVVTTLTNARTYTRDDVAKLYHKRWLAELDIRAIKCTLGMDVLRSKSPEMVRREVATCLLAYNLIRRSMLESAAAAGVSPREQSFSAAMQKIAAALVLVAAVERLTAVVAAAQREQLPAHRVGHRPNRVEPRAIKRRPKSQALLTQPREQARAELLAGGN